MNKMLLASLLFVFSYSTAQAETAKAQSPEPTKAQSAQQAKMKACNAEAKEKNLKGDERKAFMSGCLKKKPA